MSLPRRYFFDVPVVATRVGGITEIIIDGEAGFFGFAKGPRQLPKRFCSC